MDAVIDIWADDKLNRKKDANLLLDFLLARVAERSARGVKDSYVLNLNASWGQGKTFFLERLAMEIKARGHLATYVNGWRDDHGKEPLVAVMAAIEDTLKPYLSASSKRAKMWNAAKVAGGEALVAVGKGMMKRVLTRVIGDGVEEVVEILQDAPLAQHLSLPVSDGAKAKAAGSKEEEEEEPTAADDFATAVSEITDRLMTDRIQAHRQRVRSTGFFKERMSRLLVDLGSTSGGPKPPLFILIDELDRCRPTYAIEMLEQIKHLFDIDGVIFIIATDSAQLAHSISAVYGAEFDARRYLLRFFNRAFAFEPDDRLAFVQNLFATNGIDAQKLSSPPDNEHAKFFVGFMNSRGLKLRDGEQCFDILHSISTVWMKKTPLELLYLLPLIGAFQQGETAAFAALENGKPVSGDGELWTVQMPSPSERTTTAYPVDKMLSILLQILPQTFSEALRRNPGDEVSAWILQRINRELQVEHGGQIGGGRPDHSLMRSYPGLVRSLSRLTDPATERQ